MKSMHKAMRLSHHKHTGKIIHHHHTSYGVLVLLMLVPVFILSFIGLKVAADDSVLVTATVSQAPPPFPPKITSPINGSRTTSDPVVVSGDCPLANPAVFISIIEGTNVIGTTTCDNSTGKFAAPINFSYGDHTIYAQVITFTNDLGQASEPITFNRFFTVVSQGGTGGNTIPPGSAKIPLTNPILIVSGQGVVPFGLTMDAVWRGTISGGTAPYKVHVIWGDGKTDDYIISSQLQQEFRHHFDKLGSFVMVFQVSDSAGHTTSIRVIAASALPPTAPLTLDSQQAPTWYWRFVTSDIVKAYGTVFFAIITIWFFKRRHDKKEDEKHYPKTPRHPLRPAHT